MIPFAATQIRPPDSGRTAAPLLEEKGHFPRSALIAHLHHHFVHPSDARAALAPHDRPIKPVKVDFPTGPAAARKK